MEPTISTYGATDESPSRSAAHVNWLDLYDADEDEEYEYLPLPEVDEDFLDEEVAATVSDRKERRFCVLLCILVVGFLAIVSEG